MAPLQLIIDLRPRRAGSSGLAFNVDLIEAEAIHDFVKENPEASDKVVKMLAAIIIKSKSAHPSPPLGAAAVSMIDSILEQREEALIAKIQAKNEFFQGRITGAMDTATASIASSVQALTSHQAKTTWNNGIKGTMAEINLANSLQHHLNLDQPMTYKVSHCGDFNNTGDIVVLCKGRCEILIEVKDYMAKSIPAEQIHKFHADMRSSMRHGILVSLNTPITGKDNFHIELLPGNSNRIAAYLALDGQHNIELVYNVLKCIYMLDSMIVKQDLVGSSQESPEVVKLKQGISFVMTFLQDYHFKIHHLIVGLKSSLAYAQQFDFAPLYKMLAAIIESPVVLDVPPDEIPFRHLCSICKDHKGFSKPEDLKAHMRKIHAGNLPAKGIGHMPHSEAIE